MLFAGRWDTSAPPKPYTREWLSPGPMTGPLPAATPARPRERRSPGDPSCRECAPRRPCAAHADFHALVNPRRTVA
jgi:hypothetical protein